MKNIILLVYLMVLAVFDWRERKVPLVLLGGGGIAALSMFIGTLIQRPQNGAWLALSALLGLAPGVFLLVVARLTGKAGYGDGLTLLIMGLFTDYKTGILLLCFSMLLMSGFSVVALWTKRADRNTRLPYLPFLAAVYAIGILA